MSHNHYLCLFYFQLYIINSDYYVFDFALDVLDELKSLHKLEGEDARKSLSMPNPSLGSLQTATDIVCSWDYGFLKKHSSAYDDLTSPDKMPNRCLEFSLVVTLLRKFGFPQQGNQIHFVDTINNQTVEWTLGAYLHLLNADGGGSSGRASEALWVGGIYPPILENALFYPIWLILAGLFAYSLRYARKCAGTRSRLSSVLGRACSDIKHKSVVRRIVRSTSRTKENRT